MTSWLLALNILYVASGGSVYEELAVFSLATSKSHGKPPISLWDSRITPMHNTWGRLFPHLYLVFGTNIFDFNFLSRIQCKIRSNSSSSRERRRLLARTHQTRPRNEIIYYKCPLAEREANVLWVGNCTGEYFGIGPTCRLQETMRWYVRSPASAHLSGTKWFIFIDDDLYLRPWGLVSFLAKVSTKKSLKNMAIIASNTSNEFAFSQRWQGKKNLDCSMLSNYFAQPVFIPRETLESTLLSAIDDNGLVQLQQIWGGSADVILGVLFYIYDTTLYSVSYSHIEALEQLLSEDLLDEAAETFKNTPSLFIVHGLRNFKLRPPSTVDLEPDMLIKRKRLLEREFYTELSHTSVARVLGDEHPYSAQKVEEQKNSGSLAAELLFELPQSSKPARWEEKRKNFAGRFLLFTPQDCIVESKRRRLLHASSSLVSGHAHSARLDSPAAWSSITADRMWAEINRQVECWSENGRWVRGRDPTRIVTRSCLQHVRYSEGACDNQTQANSSEPHQFHWHVEASKCSAPFHPWVAPKVPNHNGSIEHLCHMLAGHSLLLVGDSIQEEFYFTLMSAFGVERFGSRVTDCNPSGVRTVYCLSGRDKSFQIAMVRNDNLSISAGQSNFDNLPWTKTLVELKTTILLVNTGAHYSADEVLLSSVETAVAHVQKNWPHVLILFRSTPIGHLDHAKHFYDPPLTDLPNLEAGHEYSYDKFAHQNALVQSLIQKRFHRNIVYFDVYNSTSRRSDSHSQDPLHYCIPGPIDHWVRIFANVLRLVDSHNWASSGSSNSNSNSSGSGSGVDKVSVAAAAIAHSPIERQWEQFSLYAASRCGAWMTDYTRLHRELRDGPSQRVLVAMTGGQGATDRLAGHLTAFLIALASRRAFLIHPYSDALPFSSSFEFPSIDLGVPRLLKERVEMAWKSMNNHPNSVTKDLFNLSIVNFHDGHPIFTAPFNNSGNEAMSSYPVLFGDDAVVLFASNRGNIYNLIGSSTMATSIELQKKGLQANWGVHCAFHYLFRPNNVVLQMAQPFASKLTDDVVKIGIQVRTGDYANFWTRIQPAQFKEKNFTVSTYNNWFKCAEDVEKKLIANGKRVIWFLMSDSLSLRIDAKEVYGDKIVTDTHSHALHTGINRNEGSASMQRVMAELLTLSLCDYFVLTFNSGVGKLAAWISDNRKKNAYIVSPDEPQCKPYSDAEMALSNQGLR